MGKFFDQFRRELARSETPLPVPAIQTRSVHTGFAAQAQHVLEGDESKIGDRILRRADEGPMDAIVRAPKVGIRVTPFMFLGGGLVPAHGGIVIVRSRIDHFAGSAMRQVDVRTFVAESELQHRHSRDFEPLAQGMHGGSNVAQILREERQPAQGLAQFVKQVVARTIHPAPVDGRGIASRNLPKLIEAAKMVEPDVVAVLGRPAQALNPPLIASRLHHIPAVKGIAPTLSGLAEEIRRHAGNYVRLKVLIQTEYIAVGPYVGAVVIHKKRHVAHDTDLALGAITPQRLPLLVEGKLQGAPDLKIIRQFLASELHRGWFATR